MDDSRKFWIALALSIVIMIADVAALLVTNMSMVLFIVIIVISVVVVIIPVLSFKGTEVRIGDGRLRVKAPFVNIDVPLSRIQAVECRESLDIGFRVFGYGGIHKGSGDFSNKEFGSYTFAGDSRIRRFVIVRFDGKRIAAFNEGDESRTDGIYRELIAATGSGNGQVISAEESEVASKGHRSMRNVLIAVVGIVVAITVIVVALSMTAGHVDVSMDDEGLHIDATMMHQDIAYTDISHVEIRYDMDYGVRTGGYGGMDVSSGSFRNDEFGSYKLAVHNSVGACIVVHHHGDRVTVFNLPDEDSTKDFYTELSKAVSGSGAVTTELRVPAATA